jgi:hypothetical protein
METNRMSTVISTKTTNAVIKFVNDWSKLRDSYYMKNYPALIVEPLLTIPGKRFIKVTENGRSVMAFIEIATGDIYKPASWAAPAKHVRGNVFSDKNGMEAVDGPYSIRYLR